MWIEEIFRMISPSIYCIPYIPSILIDQVGSFLLNIKLTDKDAAMILFASEIVCYIHRMA
jgi:hypothetical protein